MIRCERCGKEIAMCRAVVKIVPFGIVPFMRYYCSERCAETY